MEYLTTREVGKQLDICSDTVRQLARLGKLKAARTVGLNHQRLFTRAEVEKVRASRAAKKGRNGPTRKPAPQERFARLMAVSRPMVTNLIRKGALTRGGSVAQWLLEYARHMKQQAAGATEDR